MSTLLPADWTLSASAFNLTPQIVEAEVAAADLAVSLVDRGIASAIEIELGQLWRGFPDPAARDTASLRTALEARQGRVSIVGANIDEWASASRRRTHEERRAFLEPQLRAAAAVGATGVRLPIGQAGPALLDEILPIVEQLDLVLFEEVQGRQTPSDPAYAAAYDEIARRDHPRLRLLLDISMLMPAVPESYLARLAEGGVPEDLLRTLREEWRDPATQGAVFAALASGRVPADAHLLFMDLVVRFGRSSVSDIAAILPLVGGVHLKFWDLDDTDGRVSAPIRDLAPALRAAGFAGTLCSEWGGHAWRDDDPWDITRRHLDLAASALAAEHHAG